MASGSCFTRAAAPSATWSPLTPETSGHDEISSLRKSIEAEFVEERFDGGRIFRGRNQNAQAIDPAGFLRAGRKR
jgi:hypothetical protein